MVIEGDDNNNNKLTGTNNNDVLKGNKGDDILVGYQGDDTYIYNKGDGKDTIDEKLYDAFNNVSYGNDQIVLGAGISKEDIYFAKQNNDLVIKFKNNPNDQIAIREHLQGYQINIIEKLVFANGDIINLLDTNNLNLITEGDDNNNSILGSENADIIIGNKGDDFIGGRNGDDVYIFNKGDGNDTIFEYYYSSGGSSANFGNDTIKFGEDIKREDVSFTIDRNYDLVINFKNNHSDKITIKNQFGGELTRIETLEFTDNSKIDISDPSKLTLFYEGDDTDNIITASQYGDVINGYDGNDYVYSNGGTDIINLGKGDDQAVGEFGDDTYIYNKGDGKDVIIEKNDTVFRNYSYGNDKIKFGPDIKKEDVYLVTDTQSASLIVKFLRNSTDQIIIQDYFRSTSDRIETLEFADGSFIDISNPSTIHLSLEDQITNSNQNDILTGGITNNTIITHNGNDILTGDNGDDKFVIDVKANKAAGEVIETTITDFNVSGTKEVIDISLFKNITKFSDLIITPGSAVVHLSDSQTIHITNLHPSDLSADDFIFADNFAPTLNVNNHNMVVSEAVTISDDFILTSINQNQNSLPVFEDIDGVEVNPDPLSSHILTLNKAGEVIVTFKNSVAGYHNSLGYYLIDEKGNMTNPKLLFTDAKNVASATEFNLGNLTKGAKVGFFLISDGGNSALNTVSNLNQLTLSFNAKANIFSQSAPELSFNYQGQNLIVQSNIFHSYNNPFLNPDQKMHGGAGFDNNKQQILIGFEDLFGGGDKDYNDLLFHVKVNDNPDYYHNAPNLDISISDQNNIKQAVIKINNMDNHDQLLINNNNHANITISQSNNDQTITLSGEATASEYQELINSIKFIHVNSSNNNNNITNRDIIISVTDEDGAKSNITQKIIMTNNPKIGTDNNDHISGTDFNDYLMGEDGNDQLTGKAGQDILFGGDGEDYFIFTSLNDSKINAADIIEDFTKGEDTIDLSQLNNQQIHSFADLEITFENGFTKIKDNHHLDFNIELKGEIHLNEGDFNF